jgi:ABC-type nitrate/sulfonate/bicarbonate transport system substrate-binding protein
MNASSACTSSTDKEESPSDEAGERAELETTEIKYAIFSSGVPSRHVLAANDLGYFDEVGLNVEIVQAGNPGDVIPLLASGGAHLAYLGYESGFNAIGAGVGARRVRGRRRRALCAQRLG